LFSSTLFRGIHSWWNFVYRKILKCNKWESVSELIFMLERLDFRTLYSLRKAILIINLLHSSNLVLRFISSHFFNSDECLKFCGKYDIYLSSDYADIKRTVLNGFNQRSQSRAHS
jgi:hypothetical protein